VICGPGGAREGVDVAEPKIVGEHEIYLVWNATNASISGLICLGMNKLPAELVEEHVPAVNGILMS
jgi:hypothetical protein